MFNYSIPWYFFGDGTFRAANEKTVTTLDSISVSGTIFSLAGVILTVCTLVTARTIQRELQRKHRLPPLLKLLKQDMTRFNELLDLQSGLDSSEMRQVFGTLSVNLKSTYHKQGIAEVKTAMSACQKCWCREGTQKTARGSTVCWPPRLRRSRTLSKTINGG